MVLHDHSTAVTPKEVNTGEAVVVRMVDQACGQHSDFTSYPSTVVSFTVF